MNTLRRDIMILVCRVCLRMIGNQYAVSQSIWKFLNPGGVDSEINFAKVNDVTRLQKVSRAFEAA